jgi:hypothetical protein
VKNSSQIPFAELEKKTSNVDIKVCPKCGGKMKIIETWTYEKLSIDGLPNEDSPLKGWKLIKAKKPTLMSLYESNENIILSYVYDESLNKWIKN